MRAQYDDVWERRDVLGVHPQKQEGYSWVGACVPTGRIFPEDLYAFADVCEKCAPRSDCPSHVHFRHSIVSCALRMRTGCEKTSCRDVRPVGYACAAGLAVLAGLWSLSC